MGSSYSLIAKLSPNGRVRYLLNRDYTTFQAEAAETLLLDEESLDRMLQAGQEVDDFWKLFSGDTPQAIFLYTDKWEVMLGNVVYGLADRIQRSDYWFSSLLADRYSVVGYVHPTGDITYIHALFPLHYSGRQEIIELKEAEILPFLQQGDLKSIQDLVYDCPRLGRAKTVPSLYHLFKTLGENPGLFHRKLEWVFLYKGEWLAFTENSVSTGVESLAA